MRSSCPIPKEAHRKGGRTCEDCGEEAGRRVRCPRCNLLVCPYCFHHTHKLNIYLEKKKREAQAKA